MRPYLPFLTTALVTLFLAEAQRAFFASMFALGVGAFFPELQLARALFAFLPFVALLAPLLPLPRWFGRDGTLALTAAGAALFRVPMTLPGIEARLLGSALVLAFAASFLTWAVGHVERRAVAGGVVLGLVLDQLLRLAGASYHLTLQPELFPLQAVISLGVIALVLAVRDQGFGRPDDDGLERRSGGLRLRGALAFGALLFLDLHILGMGSVTARWSGLPYPLTAALLGVAGAIALAATLLAARPARSRWTALSLVALAVIAALSGFWMDGWIPALAMTGGHTAALLLVSRALDPASGRRGGVTATAGMITFALLTALFILTFYAAFTIPGLDQQVPWALGVAGVILTGAFLLQPRPSELERIFSPVVCGTVASAVAVVALVLALGISYDARSGPEPRAGAKLRVVTWNIHFGFDEEWRFDPGALAEALAGEAPDVVALQEVAAGTPTAYGVDLAYWLGRRLGMRAEFSGTINQLLGDAFLTQVGGRVDSVPLPAVGGDRKQLLRLRLDSPLTFYAVHLGVRDGARPEQARRLVEQIEPGPAVVLGDLNEEDGGPVMNRLRGAGFRDVFEAGGVPEPTYPSRRPEVQIDWIWVREVRVSGAEVLDATASDHRAVAATLHVEDVRIRSTGHP